MHHEIAEEVILSDENEKDADVSLDSFEEHEAQYSGRAIRQCVKNTPNYSHTHKGITGSAAKSKYSSSQSEPSLLTVLTFRRHAFRHRNEGQS